ncbi:uncharacterized protein LOC131044567 [Cryptomeria japonica]|uniref:uncharacterized protein LOC131044567 n=1 Tax=Cryptomeria japonica TaxID=3369 RepID=UPI0025ACEE2E|nr:uncharacterized protein LOC131044567 [Cryptomeria japonica]
MRLTKEIEEMKKNEDNLSQSLKDRSDECCRLNCENDQLKLELQQSKNNEEELERHIITLMDELVTANEYKEKFKISLAKLDENLESQKDEDDKRGLVFKKGKKDVDKDKHQDKLNKVEEDAEKLAEIKVWNEFDAKRFGELQKMIANDRSLLDTYVKGIQDALSKGGNVYKSCLSFPKFVADIEKHIMANEKLLTIISQSFDPLKKYDREGYIQSCKKSQNLGGYLHVSIEVEDIFRNMEDADAKEVIDQLNNELAEKRRRLEEIETEEEEVESESDENAVISRWRVPEKE